MSCVKYMGLLAIVAPMLSGTAVANDVYDKFPITVKDWLGAPGNSVSYSGQIARHVLHDSLKKLAGQGDGKPNAKLKAEMLSYFSGKADGRKIAAPTSKGAFVVKQTVVNQISKGKDLRGKTYKGVVSGMPNNLTGPELVEFWIDKASSAGKGVDLTNGYDYPQLISKFIMGAVSYNQVVDVYLDENLGARKKPNDKPYSKGARYTGKEHSWDEAFGYFGVPAHGLTLTPKEVYDIAKLSPSAFVKADYNRDGVVDLYKEMTFGPAYYAAGFDASVYGKSNGTSYLHTITRNFLDGRKLLAAAKGNALTNDQRSRLRGYASAIESNWEKVLAEATFKYAGSVYKDLKKLITALDARRDTGKILSDYIKHWGELKGFSLALQTGQRNLGETAVRLNRLIGYGPVLANASQVVDIDRQGNYVKDQAAGGLSEYMVHMLKTQKLMLDKFDVQARNNDAVAMLDDMLKNAGGGATAEND